MQDKKIEDQIKMKEWKIQDQMSGILLSMLHWWLDQGKDRK